MSILAYKLAQLGAGFGVGTNELSRHASAAAFPAVGEHDTLYLDDALLTLYAWSGGKYVPLNVRAVIDPVTGAMKLVNPVTGGDALKFDADGNIIANVTPRTGTLTNLLTSVAGGVREVSYATDWDAAVIHNGVAGGARILYCKPKVCTLGDATGVSVPNAAMTVMSLDAIFDPYSLASGGGVSVPAGATHFSAVLTANFAANATGRRAMTLLRNNLTNGFVSYGGIANASTTHATAVVSLPLAVPPQEIPLGTTSFHLGCYQDSGGALNLSLTPSASSLSLSFWRES